RRDRRRGGARRAGHSENREEERGAGHRWGRLSGSLFLGFSFPSSAWERRSRSSASRATPGGGLIRFALVPLPMPARQAELGGLRSQALLGNEKPRSRISSMVEQELLPGQHRPDHVLQCLPPGLRPALGRLRELGEEPLLL